MSFTTPRGSLKTPQTDISSRFNLAYAGDPRNKDTQEKTISKTLKTMGGMAGGAAEALTLQPLDTLKTRIQLSTERRTLMQTGRHIVQQEGLLALYKGLTPFVTHLVSKYALRFYSNEFYRSRLLGSDGKVSRLSGFIAGAASGITEAIIIVTPFEVVKTRLQQQRGLDTAKLKYQNPVHCVQTILREEGARALWKGCVPTMTRQGLNQCFLFGCYDLLKQKMWGVSREASISPQQAMTTGIIAGMIGPCINCPVDVVKTRLMGQMTVPGEVPKYNGMLDCLRKTYQQEGIGSLYRGLLPRLARVAPGQGITFMVMESFVHCFS